MSTKHVLGENAVHYGADATMDRQQTHRTATALATLCTAIPTFSCFLASQFHWSYADSRLGQSTKVNLWELWQTSSTLTGQMSFLADNKQRQSTEG